jgi:CHAD domain-containing protein
MGYRLSLDADVPAALRAAAVEQLEDAARLLRDGLDEDPVAAVHGARKDLKKTRSILRLARPDMPRKGYRRENEYLRDTARSISAARDADVMVETVDKLAERFAGRVPKRTFTALRKRLADQARASREHAGATITGDVVGALEAAVARVDAWPLAKTDDATLRDGAVRAYDRGRRALAAVERDLSVEALHDWRKRVKDLWYHGRLLEDAWPGPLEAQAEEAHVLSDLLGDDHDLAVLAERIEARPGPAAGAPAASGPLLELIAERRGELQAQAVRLGRRLYAERPNAYGRRLAGYLDAARAERPVGRPA